MNQISRRKFQSPGWPTRLLFLVMLTGMCYRGLSWGRADARVPVELRARLKGGKINLGQTFVEALRNRINRADEFALSSSDIPRLVFRVYAENLPGDPYLAVISVTRTVAVPWKGSLREIFLDNIVMVGVSGAHAGKDAEDILADARQNLIPKFNAIKRQGD
jgi:hypothetical protein